MVIRTFMSPGTLRCRVFVVMAVVVWWFLGGVGAYSSGAPDGVACGDMVPRHNFSPQENFTDLGLALLTTVRVEPTDQRQAIVYVALAPTSGPSLFRGFVLQARRVGGSRPVGYFSNLPDQQQGIECDGQDDAVVTHSSDLEKYAASFSWRSSKKEDTTNIYFVATIVKSFDMFWVNVTSDVLFPSLPPTPDDRVNPEDNATSTDTIPTTADSLTTVHKATTYPGDSENATMPANATSLTTAETITTDYRTTDGQNPSTVPPNDNSTQSTTIDFISNVPLSTKDNMYSPIDVSNTTTVQTTTDDGVGSTDSTGLQNATITYTGTGFTNSTVPVTDDTSGASINYTADMATSLTSSSPNVTTDYSSISTTVRGDNFTTMSANESVTTSQPNSTTMFLLTTSEPTSVVTTLQTKETTRNGSTDQPWTSDVLNTTGNVTLGNTSITTEGRFTTVDTIVTTTSEMITTSDSTSIVTRDLNNTSQSTVTADITETARTITTSPTTNATEPTTNKSMTTMLSTANASVTTLLNMTTTSDGSTVVTTTDETLANMTTTMASNESVTPTTDATVTNMTTMSSNDTVIFTTDATVTNMTTMSSNDTIIHTTDATVTNMTTISSNETVVATTDETITNMTTMSSNDTVIHTTDATVTNMTTMSSNETVIHTTDATVTNMTTMSSNDTVIHTNITTISSNETVVPTTDETLKSVTTTTTSNSTTNTTDFLTATEIMSTGGVTNVTRNMTTTANLTTTSSSISTASATTVKMSRPVSRTSAITLSSVLVTTQLPIVESNNEVFLRFRLAGQEFTDALTQPDSVEYQRLAAEVIYVMEDVFSSNNDLSKIDVVRFLRGSVIPELKLEFASSLQEEDKLLVVNDLYEAVEESGGQLGNFTVDNVAALDESGTFQSVDACFLLPCPSAANCYIDTNDGQCQSTCAQNQGYCLNGGQCVEPAPDRAVVTCRCADTYNGTRCQNQITQVQADNEARLIIILASISGVLAVLFIILACVLLCWCQRLRQSKRYIEEDPEQVAKWQARARRSLGRPDTDSSGDEVPGGHTVMSMAGTSYYRSDITQEAKPPHSLVAIPDDFDTSSGSNFYFTDSDSDSEHLIRPKLIEGGVSFPFFEQMNGSIPDLLASAADYEMDVMNRSMTTENPPLSSMRGRSVSFSDIQQVITDDDRIGFENFTFGNNADNQANNNFQVRWDFNVGDNGSSEEPNAANESGDGRNDGGGGPGGETAA